MKQRYLWSSPEFWLFSSFFCAFIGIVLVFIGMARRDSTFKRVGFYLMSPFAVCMAIVTFVFLSTTLYANWKRKRGGAAVSRKNTLRLQHTLCTLRGVFGGEMAEWFKAHAWKACVG